MARIAQGLTQLRENQLQQLQAQQQASAVAASAVRDLEVQTRRADSAGVEALTQCREELRHANAAAQAAAQTAAQAAAHTAAQAAAQGKTLEDVKEALKIAAQAAAQAAAPAAQGSGVAPTGRAPPSAAGTNVADPPARSKRGPAADSESR